MSLYTQNKEQLQGLLKASVTKERFKQMSLKSPLKD